MPRAALAHPPGKTSGDSIAAVVGEQERMSPGIVIAATLDTKSEEIQFVRDELAQFGLTAIILDCGVLGAPSIAADVSRDEIARAAGSSIEALREGRDRSVAIPAMIRGLEAALARLIAEGRVMGYLGVGGGTNAALASAAFRLLPFGLPKMLVSTVAAGDTRGFIDIKDVILVHSVVDILGLNGFLRGILRQSIAALAGAVHGMARLRENQGQDQDGGNLISLTAFGSTTPAAMRICQDLAAAGYETVTFHARGTGGRAMEALIREGRFRASLDLTTTEVADEIVGGIFSATASRLSAAGAMGIPQLILPGSLDMVNFGAPETVPAAFKGRRFVSHTPLSTLMRTTSDENATMARFIAEKLNQALGPTEVLLPLRGFSAYDTEGAPFWDPEADAAFRDTLAAELKPGIPVHRIDAHINDPACAAEASRRLLGMLSHHRSELS